MHWFRFLMAVVTTTVLATNLSAEEETCLRRIDADPQTGFAAAVLVDDAALAHTAQILPLGPDGKLIGASDAALQTRAALKNLSEALKLAGTDASQLVKLNVYLSSDDVVVAVQKVLREQLASIAKPAVSFVSGQLAKPGGLVALDAVAAVPGKGPVNVSHRSLAGDQQGRTTLVSVLPRGGVVYISGQAEKGETLADCTQKTLANLQRTLEFLKLDRQHVVQLKSFLHPMSELQAVEREIATHFEGEAIPAHVPVEWTSEGRIEIELIAYIPHNGNNTPETALSFQTPPWMTSSPVFSRLATVHSGKRLYVSGLYGENSQGETASIFDQLKVLLENSGGDFDHLAKATYYVSNDESSRELNEYRPSVYNPLRPPAASKAPVRGVGQAGKSLTLDMIAIIPQ